MLRDTQEVYDRPPSGLFNHLHIFHVCLFLRLRQDPQFGRCGCLDAGRKVRRLKLAQNDDGVNKIKTSKMKFINYSKSLKMLRILCEVAKMRIVWSSENENY